MSNECEICKSLFSTKYTLKTHREKSKSCSNIIEKNKLDNIEKNESNFICRLW